MGALLERETVVQSHPLQRQPQPPSIAAARQMPGCMPQDRGSQLQSSPRCPMLPGANSVSNRYDFEDCCKRSAPQAGRQFRRSAVVMGVCVGGGGMRPFTHSGVGALRATARTHGLGTQRNERSSQRANAHVRMRSPVDGAHEPFFQQAALAPVLPVAAHHVLHSETRSPHLRTPSAGRVCLTRWWRRWRSRQRARPSGS